MVIRVTGKRQEDVVAGHAVAVPRILGAEPPADALQSPVIEVVHRGDDQRRDESLQQPSDEREGTEAERDRSEQREPPQLPREHGTWKV